MRGTRLGVVALVAGCLVASAVLAGGDWETDFQKASAAAKAANRYMLLDFSGSDWCGWCMKLEEEVFSRKAFRDYAEENLVCVLIDFPRGKSLKKSLEEQNRALAQQYGVKGFPTVVILCPNGTVVAKTGYQEGGAEKYVAHLKQFIDPHRQKNNVPPPAAVQSGAKPSASRLAPPRPPVAQSLPRDENREMHTWKSAGGDTVVASAVEERGSFVILKKEDGSMIEVARYRLSPDDQKYLAGLKEKAVPVDGGAKAD